MACLLVFDFARPGAAVVQLLASVRLSTATFEICLLYVLGSATFLEAGFMFLPCVAPPPPLHAHTRSHFDV